MMEVLGVWGCGGLERARRHVDRATRFLVNAIDPLAIGSFRFGVGFLLLLLVALVQGHHWLTRHDWPAVAGLGLLFYAAFPILFNA
jgi:drug/metabolite transporter (DMT)-like permease